MDRTSLPHHDNIKDRPWLLFGITVLSGVLRFHRLDSPRTPVYDESYMGVIINHYHTGSEHFFDVHPPFSRLLQFYASRILGYDGDCAYSKDMKWVDCDMWAMRAVPCLLGTLLVPMAYLGCRLNGSSPHGAITAALFISTETLFFSLSRIHLLDAYTTFCIAAVVVLHAAFLRCISRHLRGTSWAAAPVFKLCFLVLADGVALGAAVSSKFGVAAPTAIWCVVCNFLACFDGFRTLAPAPFAERAARSFASFAVFSGFLAMVSIATYLGLLAWHFALIPWKGTEDGSYTAYALTKKQLSGQSLSAFDRAAESVLLGIDFEHNSGGVLEQILEFTMEQVYYYTLLDGYELEIPRLPNSHHSHHGSLWGWMVGYRGLLHALFSRQLGGQTDCAAVLFLPNPLTCCLSSIAVAATMLIFVSKAASTAFSSSYSSSESLPLHDEIGGLGNFVLVLGWCLHLIPFLSVHRELFVVYYAFAYYFGILLLALSLDHVYLRMLLPSQRPQDDSQSSSSKSNGLCRYLSCAVLAVPVFGIAAAFVRLYPLVTGLGIEPEAYLNRLMTTMPACWFGECFNAVPGSPLRELLDRSGGDERALFPFLMGSM
mmetsp:Transcript_29757/g.60806  ORF Transcript_29757/g.60806 Transcript_29757/m.60806 type:complete len:600 (+) Transcript_29757:6-1805(+)